MSKKPKIKTETLKTPLINKTSDQVSFGFSELRRISYSDADDDGKFFINFLDRLSKLCTLGWNSINTSHRHSFGTEVIDVSSMSNKAKANIPSGMNSLLAFRASGNNHVFLGYRDNNVFQVIFIEYMFGDIYNH